MGSGAAKRNPLVSWWPLLLVIALAGVFVAERVLFPKPLDSFTEQREMMDTLVSITIYASDEETADRAFETAFSSMAEVVATASIYDPEAEAARLNAAGSLDDPSADLVAILEEAVRFYEISRGAFDISIGPLLALWRFNPDAEVQFWDLDWETQESAIRQAQTLLGADRIVIERTPPRVTLAPEMEIDLGGIAKGYAVDRGLETLAAAGIEHALIDAGGDIAVFGGRPGGAGWEIALRDPEGQAAELARFEIHDGAIATSGNYERYFDPNAQVGHILDPRSGRSAERSSSATVIAPSCTEADALATTVFVLGPVEGLNVVNELEGVEAMVLAYDDPTTVAGSAGLDRYEIRKKDGT